ncbi:MAG: YggT family protein [Acidimicrobiia bacterium]|nr:YggT family protein [Acidimicrobiia bacterium]
MLPYVCYAASAYIGVMIVSIILSYVVTIGRLESDHVASRLWRMLSRLVDPVLARIRMVIKPIRIGSAMVDLSPLIVIIGLNIFQQLIGC